MSAEMIQTLVLVVYAVMVWYILRLEKKLSKAAWVIGRMNDAIEDIADGKAVAVRTKDGDVQVTVTQTQTSTL